MKSKRDERKVLEEKNFAGKVHKIAKMVVRMVAFEGLQPMVTEACTRENEDIQCGVEGGKEFTDNCMKSLIIVILIAVVTIGFAAVAFVLWKLYKHSENLFECTMETTRFRSDE